MSTQDLIKQERISIHALREESDIPSMPISVAD